jgi:hypothetical protein
MPQPKAMCVDDGMHRWSVPLEACFMPDSGADPDVYRAYRAQESAPPRGTEIDP